MSDIDISDDDSGDTADTSAQPAAEHDSDPMTEMSEAPGELTAITVARLLRKKSTDVKLMPNTASKSDVWRKFALIKYEGKLILRYAACKSCSAVFLIRNSQGKSIGTKNLSRHVSSGCSHRP